MCARTRVGAAGPFDFFSQARVFRPFDLLALLANFIDNFNLLWRGWRVGGSVQKEVQTHCWRRKPERAQVLPGPLLLRQRPKDTPAPGGH